MRKILMPALLTLPLLGMGQNVTTAVNGTPGVTLPSTGIPYMTSPTSGGQANGSQIVAAIGGATPQVTVVATNIPSYTGVDPTAASDSTAGIQSMMNAVGTLTTSNPFLANYTVFTAGGGIVHLKAGTYEVTSSLLYRGGLIFEGEGDGTQIQFCPTVAGTNLFSPDTNHWTWSSTMLAPVFRNFSVTVPSGCATAADVNDAFYMANTMHSLIQNVTIGSGFQYHAYYTINSGSAAGYYNVIQQPYWFGATVASLYIDSANGGSNSINVFGGSFRDIAGSFSKQYCVINKGLGLNIYGTSLECNATKAQVDAETPTGLYGGYDELPGATYAAPIIDCNMAASARLNGGCVVQGYLGSIIRTHGSFLSAQAPTGYGGAVIQPMTLNQGNPVSITTQLITNGNMSTASSGWTTATGIGANGTCAQVTPTNAVIVGSISGTTLTVSSVTSGTVAIGQTVGGAAQNTVISAGSGTSWTVTVSQTVASATLTLTGAYLSGFNGTKSYAMVNNGSGTLSCGQTTSYTALTPYVGQDIVYEIWVKTDGNAQGIYVGAYGACGSYGSGTGCQTVAVTSPSVLRDDGWDAYVFDVPIVSAASGTGGLTWYVVQTGAANGTTAWIGGAEAYLGGWEALPLYH